MIKEFSELKGKTLISITGGIGDEELLFKTIDGEKYRLYYGQD